MHFLSFVAGACFVRFSRYCIFLCPFCVPKVVFINMLLFWPHPGALAATESAPICASAYGSLCTACRSFWALRAFEWISFLPTQDTWCFVHSTSHR